MKNRVKIMEKIYLNYMESTPRDMEEMIKENPIAIIPFGALEWHGEHNVLGVDSIKATEICKRTIEITGGVLFPCVNYGAFKTMNFPYTFNFSTKGLIKMTKKLVKQAYDMGFKIIVLITGHYPLKQQKQVRKAAKKTSKKHDDCFALGIPENALVTDLGYFGDHAAKWETSLMMAINEDFVKLDRIPKGLNFPERGIRHGIFGLDPTKHASKESGEQILIEIVKRLSEAILKVKETQTSEPFDRIYTDFKEAMKSLRKFKNLFKVQGIKDVKEGLAYLKWSLFKKKKHNPDYEFKRKD